MIGPRFFRVADPSPPRTWAQPPEPVDR